MKLTSAQERILLAVNNHGERVYNGRAARPVRRLEELGLVTVARDMLPQAKGNGMELVERLTVTCTAKGQTRY